MTPHFVLMHRLRRLALVACVCVPLTLSAACSQAEDEPSSAQPGEPGVTAPSVPAPPPTTHPKQLNRQACAEVFQILNTSLSKLNAAMKINKKDPVTKAVADLRSAATQANTIAAKSGDKKLVELTDSVGESIRTIAKRFQNEEDAETGVLNDRTDALQDYCNTFVPGGAKPSTSGTSTTSGTSSSKSSTTTKS